MTRRRGPCYTSRETRVEFEDRILIFMRANPKGEVLTEDVAAHFNYSTRAMRVRLDDLKDEGRIKMVRRTSKSNVWKATP